MNALGRLLPRIGGLEGEGPRLYARMVRSRILYELLFEADPAGIDVRVQTQWNLLESWWASLDKKAGAPSLRALEAILSNWGVWLGRRWASLDVQGYASAHRARILR